MTKRTVGYPESVAGEPPAGLTAMCITTFLSSDASKAVTVGASLWESVTAADDHFQTVRDSIGTSVGVQLEQADLGDRSFKLEANRSGVGGFVVFRNGVHLVQVSTAMPAGETPLFTLDQLEQLATTIESKLR